MNTNSDINIVSPLMQTPVSSEALAIGRDNQKRQNNAKRQPVKKHQGMPIQDENITDEQQSDGLDFCA